MIVVRYCDEIIDIMKSYGIKDISKLKKVPVVDKNGHTRMVYVNPNKKKPVVKPKKKIENKSMDKSPFKTEQDKREFGIALYTLNKEAKRIRNIKNDLFDYNNGGYGTKEIADLVGLDFDDEDGLYKYSSEDRKLTKDNIYEYYDDVKHSLTNAENERDNAEVGSDEYDDADYDVDFYANELKSVEKIKDKFDKLKTTRVKNTDEGYIRVGKQNDIMDNLKLQEDSIYSLKNKVLQKIKPEIIAYHEFPEGDIRPLYKIGDFTFHGIETEKLPENAKVEKLNTISSENKLNDSEKISVEEAKNIIEKYI